MKSRKIMVFIVSIYYVIVVSDWKINVSQFICNFGFFFSFFFLRLFLLFVIKLANEGSLLFLSCYQVCQSLPKQN